MFNEEDFLAGLEDDTAVENLINTMANEGVSTENPTIPEGKAVAILTKLELNFSLTKGFLADPINWKPSEKAFNKDPFWYNLTGIFETQSEDIRTLLGRDNNPTYRVGGFDSRTVKKFPANIPVITSAKDGKPIGIDWTNPNLVNLLGDILSQFGFAEKKEGTHTYIVSTQFFEFVNNGVHVLKESLMEKARAREPISDDVAKNDIRLIPYFVAAKQMENLTELLKQRPESEREYVITIGRRPRENDASRQENYVKDYVHVSTESGQVALNEVNYK